MEHNFHKICLEGLCNIQIYMQCNFFVFNTTENGREVKGTGNTNRYYKDQVSDKTEVLKKTEC